jgi:hypothetical protein
VITVSLMTMKRNGGVVNGLSFNPQLTVKLSVFSRLQSLLNWSSGFCGTPSRPDPLNVELHRCVLIGEKDGRFLAFPQLRTH